MFGSEHNVRVDSQSEPEHLFRFRFNGLTEPNLEHLFGFRFEHCLECSEPDRGQSRRERGKKERALRLFLVSSSLSKVFRKLIGDLLPADRDVSTSKSEMFVARLVM